LARSCDARRRARCCAVRRPKTLLRRGTARRGRLDLAGARRDYQHVLSLEPNNKRGPAIP